MKFTALIVVMAGLQCCSFVASDGCDAGWQPHGDSCYLFKKTLMNQTDAENFCRTQAGYLAEPTVEGINTFLKETLRQDSGSDENYWIGGTDLTEEGQWHWLHSGKCFSYTDWYAGEPNDLEGEDCNHFSAYFDYQWNDSDCSIKEFFICEKKQIETCTSKRNSLGSVI
nr:C-type lectin [Glycymeris yessoensis]